MGATGITETILSKLLGEYKIKEIQKQPYWALHTYKESANITEQNILHGRNNITRSTNCKYRTAATLYDVEIFLVSAI